MIPIPGAFRAGLCRQIRQQGFCEIRLYLSTGGYYDVPGQYIKSVELHGVGDPLSRKLPTEECTIVLTDYERLWDPATPGSYVDNVDTGMQALVRFGLAPTGTGRTIWSDYVSYYLKDKPKWSNFSATFQFTRQVGLLKSAFPGINTNSSDLEMLTYYALAGAYYDPRQVQSVVSPKLANCPVINNTDIQGKTVADTLLTVAFATGTSLRSGMNGIEILNHYDVSEEGTVKNPAIVRENDIMDMPKFSRLPLVKNILVNYWKDPDQPQERVLLFDVTSDYAPTEEEPLVIFFEKAISGGSFQWYLRQNVSSMTATVYRDHVVITSITRTNQTIPYVIKGTGTPLTAEKVQKLSFGHIDGTEIEEIENPLLNWTNCGDDPNMPFGRKVPAIRATYLVRTRDLYEFSYRGDPSIEHLDVITVELPGIGFVPCIVIESVFRYEKGFSGKLKVRPIKSASAYQTTHSAISDLAISDYAKSDSEA